MCTPSDAAGEGFSAVFMHNSKQVDHTPALGGGRSTKCVGRSGQLPWVGMALKFVFSLKQTDATSALLAFGDIPHQAEVYCSQFWKLGSPRSRWSVQAHSWRRTYCARIGENRGEHPRPSGFFFFFLNKGTDPFPKGRALMSLSPLPGPIS
jgi:hypothetical protein